MVGKKEAGALLGGASCLISVPSFVQIGEASLADALRGGWLFPTRLRPSQPWSSVTHYRARVRAYSSALPAAGVESSADSYQCAFVDQRAGRQFIAPKRSDQSQMRLRFDSDLNPFKKLDGPHTAWRHSRMAGFRTTCCMCGASMLRRNNYHSSKSKVTCSAKCKRARKTERQKERRHAGAKSAWGKKMTLFFPGFDPLVMDTTPRPSSSPKSTGQAKSKGKGRAIASRPK